MFPGMGKINPRQLQNMMKSMGIKTEEIDAQKVIFELKDKKMVIENPKITVMEVQGQKTYTIMGNATQEQKGIPKEDIEMVTAQSGVSKEKAENALEKNNGDIAAAIMELKEDNKD